MNAALAHSWTLEKFLAWEARQEGRYEFDGFRPVAMTGGTLEHDRIQVNLIRALGNRHDGKPCRVHGNSLKIQVMGSIRYPDTFVSCTPVERGSTLVHEPVVIFEVLSRGTAHTDRMVKNREYAATASVRRYIMLEQKAVDGMMFTRSADDTAWTGMILNAGDTIHMPEIGIDLPLSELYAGVEFDTAEAEQEP
jgi:Uma2 family endonuclease